MTKPSQARPKTLWFPLWANVLETDTTLTPGLRQSYRRTIAGFLAFCHQRQAAASVTVAREYMEVARLQDNPMPARLQERKDGLNWFFRRGREAGSSLRDVPRVARTDLGRLDWEQRFIAKLRLTSTLRPTKPANYRSIQEWHS